MNIIKNPFVTAGYISPEYFCDRETESKQLVSEITTGNKCRGYSALSYSKV